MSKIWFKNRRNGLIKKGKHIDRLRKLSKSPYKKMKAIFIENRKCTIKNKKEIGQQEPMFVTELKKSAKYNGIYIEKSQTRNLHLYGYK